MEQIIDVAQLVIRTEQEKFFLAKRSKDGYWEWIGGKKEEGEGLEEAAVRELKEEIKLEWSEDDYRIERIGDSYLSSDNEKYRLNPVLVKVGEGKAGEVEKADLSAEHKDFEWIQLQEFDSYETLGQYQALENLEIVKGRVALAVLKKDGKLLAVKRSPENSSAGKWGFVSGRIEGGETVEEAAKRELEEETGLKARTVETFDYYIGKGEKGFWRLEPVLMELVSGNVDLNWELSEYRWIKTGELKDLETLGRMEALERLGIS